MQTRRAMREVSGMDDEVMVDEIEVGGEEGEAADEALTPEAEEVVGGEGKMAEWLGMAEEGVAVAGGVGGPGGGRGGGGGGGGGGGERGLGAVGHARGPHRGVRGGRLRGGTVSDAMQEILPQLASGRLCLPAGGED